MSTAHDRSTCKEMEVNFDPEGETDFKEEVWCVSKSGHFNKMGTVGSTNTFVYRYRYINIGQCTTENLLITTSRKKVLFSQPTLQMWCSHSWSVVWNYLCNKNYRKNSVYFYIANVLLIPFKKVMNILRLCYNSVKILYWT